MSKSKRLMELMMAVNRKRRFTVKELASDFGVSPRTILRDLQELSELGVPLYSEVGPHGGYRVLNERMLPPIAFTEEEAVSVFFAVHALRHYTSLPFAAESSSALKKFYHYMPEDTQDRIDQMKQRIDFVTPKRQAASPHLAMLLDAAIRQQVLKIEYASREKRSQRDIQPIGIYTRNGLWYCPAYCYQTDGFRVFRCDRIRSAFPSETPPRDLRHIQFENREPAHRSDQHCIPLLAELTPVGVQICEAEPWAEPMLHRREDGSGWLEGNMPENELDFFAKFMIGLGDEAELKGAPELRLHIRKVLDGLMTKYG
ncbi:YafY family protein [Paenibacillus sp. VCA1]|uniref:helix-turn-helix transcriptional regulator n=1 Tax=Paenibacillus sp. VCA1 TaxID=3039148 RepID=UPI002871FFAB|nr:YafY family protein [Paenibacillus sp. VCA1]MDR9854513.1 YafY family protein [Paenibacillus sp. VCA1]